MLKINCHLTLGGSCDTVSDKEGMEPASIAQAASGGNLYQK